MKKVLLAGSFEIIHPGHIELLNFAKSLGNHLTVIVSRDSSFEKIKKRKSIVPENQRMFVVENLKSVDKAILGDKHSFLVPILETKPDIIVLGYDQTVFSVESLKSKLENSLPNTKIVLAPKFEKFELNKTGKIIEKIKNITY